MFEIHDCYGAPQCGYDVIVVDTWEEVEEYFCYDDDAAERLEMGYADWIELQAMRPARWWGALFLPYGKLLTAFI